MFSGQCRKTAFFACTIPRCYVSRSTYELSIVESHLYQEKRGWGVDLQYLFNDDMQCTVYRVVGKTVAVTLVE